MYLYYYFISVPLMILSNLMIIFSKSFFFMWMVMEINLISFISMMIMNKTIFSEKIMNYFIIQSFNSHMFFMCNLMLNLNLLNKMFLMFIFLSMLSKMGMPPFHLWYLNLMKSLNWILFFFNSSIQKFIPMMILNFWMNKSIFMFKLLMFIILVISSLIPLYGMNTFSLKLIMCFSSIIQISWILMMMNISEINWMIYYLIYSLISASMFYMFYMFNMNYLTNINKNNLNNNFILYFLALNFISLAGLPPFTGFINKWMFINMSFNKYSLYFNLIILILSLLNLFYYSRSIIQIFMFYYSSMNLNYKFINLKFNYNFKITLLTLHSLLMIMLYEMI